MKLQMTRLKNVRFSNMGSFVNISVTAIVPVMIAVEKSSIVLFWSNKYNKLKVIITPMIIDKNGVINIPTGANCSKYIIEKGMIPMNEAKGINIIFSFSFLIVSFVISIINAAE